MSEENTTTVESTNEAPTPPTKPEYVPDKFWNADTGEVNVEGMATSYAHLETKLGNPSEETTETPATETQAGLDLQPLADHYAQEGGLSEDHYAYLESNGISKEYADQYIHGLAASQQVFTQEIHNEVGGQENFGAMYEWAKAELPSEEFGAFEKSLTDVNITDASAIDSLKLGIKGMYARWRSNTSQPPKATVEGSTSAGVASDVYASKYEMYQEMNSPQYKRDEAFRDRVANKIARTQKHNANF